MPQDEQQQEQPGGNLPPALKFMFIKFTQQGQYVVKRLIADPIDSTYDLSACGLDPASIDMGGCLGLVGKDWKTKFPHEQLQLLWPGIGASDSQPVLVAGKQTSVVKPPPAASTQPGGGGSSAGVAAGGASSILPTEPKEFDIVWATGRAPTPVIVSDHKEWTKVMKEYSLAGVREQQTEGSNTNNLITNFKALKSGRSYTAVLHHELGKPVGKTITLYCEGPQEGARGAYDWVDSTVHIKDSPNMNGLLAHYGGFHPMNPATLKFDQSIKIVHFDDVQDGGHYAAAYSIISTVNNMKRWQGSMIAGGEASFMQALKHEHDSVLEPCEVINMNGQLFDVHGTNYAQLDALTVSRNFAVIGNKKTKVRPEHVEKLQKTIEVIKAKRDVEQALAMFRDKDVLGAIGSDALPSDSEALDALEQELDKYGVAMLLPSGNQYTTGRDINVSGRGYRPLRPHPPRPTQAQLSAHRLVKLRRQPLQLIKGGQASTMCFGT